MQERQNCKHSKRIDEKENNVALFILIMPVEAYSPSALLRSKFKMIRISCVFTNKAHGARSSSLVFMARITLMKIYRAWRCLTVEQIHVLKKDMSKHNIWRCLLLCRVSINASRVIPFNFTMLSLCSHV